MCKTLFKCSLDSHRYTTTPPKSDMFDISDRIGYGHHEVNQENIKNFATLVGSGGRTFCPASFKEVDRSDPESTRKAFQEGLRRIDNFEQIQLFGLEFNNYGTDKLISFDEVRERSEAYNIPILFAYHQFSSGKVNGAEKFTVVFLNDTSVIYPKVAEIMLDALLTVFPEASHDCTDYTKMYYGGNEPLLHFDESTPMINIDLLIRGMTIWLRNKYGDTNYKRKVAEFAKHNNIRLTPKGILDISIVRPDDNVIADVIQLGLINKSSPESIILLESSGENLLTQSYVIRMGTNTHSLSTSSYDDSTGTAVQKKSKVHNLFRSEAIDHIRPVCQLFREFEAGSRELKSHELFTLATVMLNIETGARLFLAALQTHSNYLSYAKTYEYWVKNLSIMSQKRYDPIRCAIHCPYRDQCHHGGDILSMAKQKLHTTMRLANYTREQVYPVEVAAEDFRQKFAIAAEDDANCIHAINSPTGTGKSSMTLDYMEGHQDEIFLYSCSTNDLKNELYGKSKYKFDSVKSPSLYELKNKLPPDIWKRIEWLHQIGKHHAVYDYIKEVIGEEKADRKCIELLKTYLNELTKFYNSNCNAFTTHSRLMTMDYWSLKKYAAVVIDEDIVMNYMLVNQESMLVTELEKILEQIEADCDLAKKINAAVRAAETNLLFTLKRIEYSREYDAISSDIDIASFCLAEKFYFKKKSDESNLLETTQAENSIVFFRPFKLYPKIKYIVLSATIDHKIYDYCFGAKRVRFYECRKAENIGTLNQYPEYTMSRAFISDNLFILNQIKEFTKVKHTITFKKYLEYINATLYFGKTTGVDFLKKEDIDVIGTPHQPQWVYKLFAYTMGHDRFDADAKMRYQKVRDDHTGFQFWFMTFDDELLRNIHLWMVRSELCQAIGRARLTREECTVNVFSNYPLPHADFQKLPEHIKSKCQDGKEQ